MDTIITEVYHEMLKVCSNTATPTSIIQTGVELLQKKNIDKNLKKEIIKAVVRKFALGTDGISNTEDDRLSEQTLVVLIMLIESDLIDTVIDGIVSQIKKSGFTKCFHRFGMLIQYKKN